MRLVMMGTGTFAEPTFEAVLTAFSGQVVGLVTQPEKHVGRSGGSTRQTGRGMSEIAADHGVPVIQPPSINTPEGLDELRAFRPDMLVVAAYGQILRPDVIGTPTFGAINVHASLLPKYRGAAPVAHAILNGESETGVTIIRIATGLDAGEMLAQQSLAIAPLETAGELEARLAPLGAALAVEVIRKMQRGPIHGTPQNPAQVTKAPKLTKEMGRIDWHTPAAFISHQVRAMQPWPTAYTFLHRPGKPQMRVAINRCVVATPAVTDEQPGDVRVIDVNRILVIAGQQSALELLELQPAGKKRMSAAEFARGYLTQPGSRFGPDAPG